MTDKEIVTFLDGHSESIKAFFDEVKSKKFYSCEEGINYLLPFFQISAKFAGIIPYFENQVLLGSSSEPKLKKHNKEMAHMMLRLMYYPDSLIGSDGVEHFHHFEHLMIQLARTQNGVNISSFLYMQESNIFKTQTGKLTQIIHQAMQHLETGAVLCLVLEYLTPMIVGHVEHMCRYTRTDDFKKVFYETPTYVTKHHIKGVGKQRFGFHLFRALAQYDEAIANEWVKTHALVYLKVFRQLLYAMIHQQAKR